MSNPRVLVVEHEAEAALGNFGPWLHGAGVAFRIVRPYAGEAVPQAVAEDGLIVLGGAMGACEDDRAPWLPATRALIRTVVAGDVPLLGVCLGAQLLAVACGGRVERGGKGPEIGVVDVEILAPEDALFRGIRSPAPFVQWHYDAMVELPPGAAVLASSPMYPHQGFRLGSRAWGVQFHPEVTRADVATWARHDGSALRDVGLDAVSVLAGVDARAAEVAAASRAIAVNFAAILRS